MSLSDKFKLLCGASMSWPLDGSVQLIVFAEGNVHTKKTNSGLCSVCRCKMIILITGGSVVN